MIVEKELGVEEGEPWGEQELGAEERETAEGRSALSSGEAATGGKAETRVKTVVRWGGLGRCDRGGSQLRIKVVPDLGG